MAAVAYPDAHEVAHAETSFWRHYIFSVDHKVIGRQYLFLGLFMGFVGVFLSYVFRWQLAWPNNAVPGWGKVTAPQYNELVTMHGTIMVFFVAMPVLLGAFGNFLIPLMVGARDMAFPRLNMASFWTIFVGSVLLLISFVVPGGASRAGWTNYVPLSDVPSYTGGVYWGGNLWLMALAIDFASVLMGGINFLTTAIAMRAPGMTMGADALDGVAGTAGERALHVERRTTYRGSGDAAFRSDVGHRFFPSRKRR
jgi:cytochrome c oxidase subunit 1